MSYLTGITQCFKRIDYVWYCRKDLTKAIEFAEGKRHYLQCPKDGCLETEQVYIEEGYKTPILEE